MPHIAILQLILKISKIGSNSHSEGIVLRSNESLQKKMIIQLTLYKEKTLWDAIIIAPAGNLDLHLA
jgi:hypothetical protein